VGAAAAGQIGVEFVSLGGVAQGPPQGGHGDVRVRVEHAQPGDREPVQAGDASVDRALVGGDDPDVQRGAERAGLPGGGVQQFRPPPVVPGQLDQHGLEPGRGEEPSAVTDRAPCAPEAVVGDASLTSSGRGDVDLCPVWVSSSHLLTG
jgi:hypothetical protein